MNGNSLSKNDYIRKRVQTVGVSMIVMGGSFVLYYLGLFGNVEGPLTPGKIGNALSDMGITKDHALIFFLSFFIIALTWNHIFNLASFMVSSRLTCMKKNHGGDICGASVEKIKKNTGKRKKGAQFKCSNGHICSHANFHPLKKGAISHTVWVSALLFCLILLYGT